MAHIVADNPPVPLDWHRYGQAGAAVAAHDFAGEAARSRETARDAGFVALQAGYRSHGGIAQGAALAACLGRAGRGGFVDLAQRIAAGELFSFHWHDTFWVPLFQFHPVRLTLLAPPRQVLDELRGVLDGWDIAHWHVRCHDGLRGRRPLDLLDTELDAVLAAARADRRAAGA